MSPELVPIFLNKSMEYMEKRLAQQWQGSLKEAGHSFLQAAEFLFKAAKKSEPTLKQKYIESFLKPIRAG